VILACTVLIQLTSVTDRQTDRQTDRRTDRRPDDGKDARSILLSRVKTCCLRIGRQASVSCASIVTLNGIALQWSDELRYLGVYIARSSRFNISLDKPKRSFYRASNRVFGKVGCVASEEVTIQLFNSQCVSVLLYAPEACSLSKSDLSSIDFAFTRFFIKLFSTNNIKTVKSI